ncbi:MAG: SGNH/GDSL hydrolase family protein [Planctomycetota bacterium]
MALSRKRKLIFLLAILGLTLLLTEGVLHLVVSPQPEVFVPHPYLRHVRAPNSNQEYLTLDGEQRYVLGVDAHGFRAQGLPDPLVPKPEGEYRIFFVGASTTENRVIPDPQTFPELVEARLGERGVKVIAINTAISGNSVADSFSLVAHRILALEPDLIVVLHAINDMRATLSERFDPAHYDDRKPPKPPTFDDVFTRYVRLYDLAGRLKKRLKDDRDTEMRARARAVPYTEGVDPTKGLDYFTRYLRMIALLCRDEGVPLVFCSQPSIYREDLREDELASLWMGLINRGELNLDPVTLMHGMQAYNQRIAAVCREWGVRFVDLDAAVPKDLTHFYDDCHYTVEGNAAVADALYQGLFQGELPREPLPLPRR